MKNLRNVSIEYQGNEIETASPKDLRSTVSGLSRREALHRLQDAAGVQPIGVQPEENVSERTIKRLDGKRIWVEAVIERFGSRPGYKGYAEKRILLKNVKFRDSGKLFKEWLWLPCGKWTERLQVGATIAFDARLENSGLKNPTNVTLIEPGPGQGGGTHGADQMLMF